MMLDFSSKLVIGYFTGVSFILGTGLSFLTLFSKEFFGGLLTPVLMGFAVAIAVFTGLLIKGGDVW